MTLANSLQLYSNLLFYTIKSKSPRDYQGQWNNYWASVHKTGTQGEVLWDNVPERASKEDLGRFKAHMDESLPILDLGSGNGRQSRFLAQHFGRVIGVDASARAVELARKETVDETNIEFRVADMTDIEEAKKLHNEFGDMNIYMRGVFHVIQKPDRANFVASLAVLLGEKGTLYQIELTSGALSYFRTLPGDSPSGLPKLLHKVVTFGIRPIGFKLEDVNKIYPEDHWSVIDRGDDVTINTIPMSHGEEGLVPANYLIAKPKS